MAGDQSGYDPPVDLVSPRERGFHPETEGSAGVIGHRSGKEVNDRSLSQNVDAFWRTVISGTCWSLGTRLVTAFLGVVSTVLLARWLGADGLGVYLTLSAWVLFLTHPAQLGLGETAVREIAALVGQDRLEAVWAAVRDFLVLGLLGALAAGAAMLVVAATFGTIPSNTGLWAAVWVTSSALMGLITSFGRGFMNKWAIADSGQFISSVIFVLTLLTALLFNHQGSSSLAFALKAGASVCGLVTIFFIILRLHPQKGKATILTLRGMRRPSVHWLTKSWPILVHHLIRGLLVHADIVLLGLVRPMQEVAVYGIASRLVTLIAFPMVSLHSALAPIISKLHTAGDHQGLQKTVRRAVLLCGIPALIGFAALALAGPFVLTHFYGEVYKTGFSVLIVLSLSKLIYVFSGPAGLTLLMTGWQRSMFRITLLSAVIMVVLGLWWSRSFGGIGMAWAVSTAEATRFILMSAAVKQKLGIKTRLF